MRTRTLLLLGIVALVAFMLVHRTHHVPHPESVEMVAPPLVPIVTAPEMARPTNTENVPARIRGVITSSNLVVRMSKVRNLPRDLDSDETAGLLRLLAEPDDASGSPRGLVLAFKNDLILALRNQARPVDELPSTLIALFRGPQTDLALRDYAIQHLATWCEELQTRGTKTPQEEKQAHEAINLLTSALEERASSIAGTALLSLHRVSMVQDIPSLDVSEHARRLLNDSETGELSLVTAIQVCAKRQIQEQLPKIVEVATGHSSVPARLSAVAAIAVLGGNNERELLQTLAESDDLRVSGAAQAALRKLTSRASSLPENQNI